MALHEHTVRNDRLEEQLGLATQLGEYKIPAAMTLPLAQLKRELRAQVETWHDAKQMHQDQHTEGAWVEPKAPGEKRRFVPEPVYQKNEDGTIKFKLDKDNKETTEPLVAQGKIQLKNSVEYNREVRAMERETVTFKVPHISWPQLEGKVGSLPANIVEGLMEYFDDLPKADAPPAGKKKGEKAAAAT